MRSSLGSGDRVEVMAALKGLVAVVALVCLVTQARSDALDIARAGFAAKERREFQTAIRFFDEALRQGGSFGSEQRGYLLYSRGVSYEALGVRDKALSDLDAAIAFLPNFANSFIYRAIIWTDRQEYDRALDDLLQAARITPKDPLVLINLGGVYDKKGDTDRAIASFDQAISLLPGYAQAYYNRGNAYLKKPDLDRAISDYGQAIWLEPRFAEAYGNRGAVYLTRGETDKAIADFGAAISLRPQDVTFLGNRANAYLTIASYTAAENDFGQALQIDPGNPAIYLGRGRSRLFAGNTAGSIEDFGTAVRLRASNPNTVVWLHIARVHHGEKDKDEFATNAAKVKRDVWPTPVLDFYLGSVDAERLRALAVNGDQIGKEKRSCEADFFIGEYTLHNGNPQDARQILERVVAQCRAHDLVYGAAVAELRLIPR